MYELSRLQIDYNGSFPLNGWVTELELQEDCQDCLVERGRRNEEGQETRQDTALHSPSTRHLSVHYVKCAATNSERLTFLISTVIMFLNSPSKTFSYLSSSWWLVLPPSWWTLSGDISSELQSHLSRAEMIDRVEGREGWGGLETVSLSPAPAAASRQVKHK